MAVMFPDGFRVAGFPVARVNVLDCGALRLSRTRCYSSGVINELPGESAYRLLWLIEGRVDLMRGLASRSLRSADVVFSDASVPLACDIRPGEANADWLSVRIPQGLLAGGRPVAEAHHISVRQLHKLFHRRGLTVSSWIRERRLAGWRRALADPSNRGRSVQGLARDWGLHSSAHASRLFREAYGITPAAYRRSVR